MRTSKKAERAQIHQSSLLIGGRCWRRNHRDHKSKNGDSDEKSKTVQVEDLKTSFLFELYRLKWTRSKNITRNTMAIWIIKKNLQKLHFLGRNLANPNKTPYRIDHAADNCDNKCHCKRAIDVLKMILHILLELVVQRRKSALQVAQNIGLINTRHCCLLKTFIFQLS